MKAFVIVSFVAAGLVAACATKPERPRPLPQSHPPTPRLEFAGPEGGWPPAPKGQTNIHEVPYREIPDSVTEARLDALRATAQNDARVRQLLGERFAYITSDEVEPKKNEHADRASWPVRVTFYSHSNNVAVEAILKGDAVQDVRRREGYQPPEGAEEMKQAVALAQRDERLADKTGGLASNAIVIFPREGQPGSGHRVLHASFHKPDDPDHMLYRAIVDLTDQRVLTAGPAPGH
jgi:hypothetical protein